MSIDVMDPGAPWAGILNIYLAERNKIMDLQAQIEPGASGRKALSELVEQNPDVAESAREIIKHIQNEDTEARSVLAAVFIGEGLAILREIQKQFITAHTNELEELDPEVKADIEAQIEKGLNAARGLLQAVIGYIDNEEASAEVPKLPRKRGGTRTVGKRIKGVWNLSIKNADGVTEKHTAKKAKDLGQLVDMKVGEISAKMEAAGLKPGELPEYWTLELNGRNVEAYLNAEVEDTPEGETDEEEEVEETEEDTV